MADVSREEAVAELEDGQRRMDQLLEGLTDEEAAELGRLYAEKRGEPYQDSSSVSDADSSSRDRTSPIRATNTGTCSTTAVCSIGSAG